MAYSDSFNIRTRFVTFNNVADAIDGTITRQSGGTTMGSNTAYTASPIPAWSSPIAPGSYITFIPHLTNGANATLTVSNIGPSLLKRAGVNISAGALTQGVPYLCLYTGAYWEVVSSTETPATQFLPLTLDKTNNRVGVNSTSPQAVMDVYSASSSVAHLAVRGLQTASGGSGAAAIQIDVNGLGGFAIQNNGVGGTRKLQIASNNGYGSGTAVFFTATAGGAIGINNDSPSAALHVHSLNSNYSGLGNVVSVHSLSDSHASVILGVQNGNAPYIAAGKMTNGTGAFTSLRFKTSNVDALVIETDSKAYFAANQYGRVYHTTRSSGETVDAGGFYCQVDGTNYGWVRLNETHVQLEVRSGSDLVMKAHGVEKGRFGTDGFGTTGNIYINKPEPYIYLQDTNHRSCMLHCNEDNFYLLNGVGVNSLGFTTINGRYAFQVNLATNYVTLGGTLDMPNGIFTPQTLLISGVNRSVLNISNQYLTIIDSTAGLRVPGTTSDSGTTLVMTAAGTIRMQSSSLEYKKDIEDIEDPYVENILNLRPVWYRLKTEFAPETNPTWSWYGLIAEEVAEVDPRLASFRYRDEDIDSETGEISASAVMVPRGVDYSRLSVLLLQLIKKQRATITSMEARLAAVEEALGMP